MMSLELQTRKCGQRPEGIPPVVCVGSGQEEEVIESGACLERRKNC